MSVRHLAEEYAVPEPLIIQYTNLLNKFRDPNADEVRRFVEEHRDDQIFVQRAAKLDKIFGLKQQLTTPR